MTSSTKQRLRRLVIACLATASLGATGAQQEDFNAAYEAYRTAAAEGRHADAATHVGTAKQLAEAAFPDDPDGARRIATLTFHHGLALSKAKHFEHAYAVLQDARRLMRAAYGDDAKELVDVEVALVGAAPANAARKHLRRATRLARQHGEDMSASIANAKAMVGMRVRGRSGRRFLEEAVAVYEELGHNDGLALANFWLGKLRARNDFDEAAEHFEAALAFAGQGDADRRTRRSLVLMTHANLVEVLEKAGRSEEATKHCRAIGRLKPWDGTADYQPLYKRHPRYPAGAVRQGQEGWVLAEFGVDENGFVREPKVVASAGGTQFEKAALTAVRGFRYAPKFVDGEAVAVDGVRNTILFELRD